MLEEKARQIIVRLFSGYAQKELTLKEAEFSLECKLIKEQIKAFKLRQSWLQVRQWSDLTLPYLETIESCEDFYVAFGVSKVEALLKLGQLAEALDAAYRTICKRVTYQTTSVYFQALIRIEDICEEEVVLRLKVQHLRLLRPNSSANGCVDEVYFQILQCLDCSNSVPDCIGTQRRNLLVIHLLKYVIEFYQGQKLWDLLAKEEKERNSIISLLQGYVAQRLKQFFSFRSQGTIERGDQDKIVLERAIMKEIILEDTTRLGWIRYHILGALETFLAIINDINQDPLTSCWDALGNENDMQSFIQLVSSVGFQMCLCAHESSSDIVKRGSYLLGADLLTLSSKCYTRVGSNQVEVIQNKAKFLLTAAAACYDTASLQSIAEVEMDEISALTSLSSDSQLSHTGSEFVNLHTKARQLARKAQNLLLDQLDFGDVMDRKIFSSAVILELTSYCRSGELKDSEKFISSNFNRLMYLDMEDMRKCIELVTSSRNVSTEASRTLLSVAEKICLQFTPVHKSTGFVFGKIIQLSSSRSSALKKVQEFARLLEFKANLETISTEDIDYITAHVHNAAVSLLELGQHDLATKFNDLALFLLNYCTLEQQDDWVERMKV